jgi:O-antigen/teichoic acid export membrane protein
MSLQSTIRQYSNNPEVKVIGIYTFSNFFNKGVSFLLLFYFTKVLTESDFGMLSLFNTSILFVMPFISLGILQSVNSDFFKLTKFEFKNFFSTSLILTICVTAITIGALGFFNNTLQQNFHFPFSFVALIPIIAMLSFINEQLVILLRNNQQPVEYFLVNVGRLAIEILIAVSLISAMHYGWLGRVAGIVVSYLLLATYSVYYFIKQGYIFGKIKRQYFKAELVFGVPIIVMQLGIFCLSSSAVYYISHFTNNLQLVGSFSVAATFASIVNVFCTALLQYVQPKLYNIFSQKTIDNAAIKKLFIFYAVAMLLFTIVIIIVLPFVYHFLLKQTYLPGLQYCYLLCIGQFFWAIAWFFFLWMLYYKEKRKILILSISAVVVSVVFNWILTGLYAASGAAIATIVSYTVILLLVVYFVQPMLKVMMQKDTSQSII